MPTQTYTPLANVTLGSSASSVTFSNIPATYRDLILVANGASAITNDFAYIRFNSDTGSNYSWVQMGGQSSGSFSSSTTTTSWRPTNFDFSGSRIVSTIQIMDYSATDKHKTGLIRDNGQHGSDHVVRAYGARWANTAAITSIQYFTTAGNLNAGFTLSLYGVIS